MSAVPRKDKRRQSATSDGYWSGCVDFFSDAIASGDRIKVVDYDTNQTLNYTVPRMTLSANRSTDVASGVAPAGLHMTLEAADFNTPLFGKDPYDVFVDLVADGGGTWSHDFGADDIDLMTGAGLELSASGAGGAVTVRRDFSVPGLFVLLDSARFGGYMRPYFPIGITLKTGGSTVATGHAVGDASGQYDGRFVDGVGEPYRLMGGETLSAPKLGISWTVPQVNGTANRQSDVVAGTCFANNPWVVIAGVFAFANGMTDGSGAFSVDLSDQGGIAKGDQVIIGCFSGAGDVVEEDLVVN